MPTNASIDPAAISRRRRVMREQPCENNAAAGDKKDKIQKGKVYIFFLGSKQGCCLNLGSYCLVDKKICFCRLSNKLPAL